MKQNLLPQANKKSAWRNFFIGITLATIIVFVAVWVFVGKKLPTLITQAQTIISQEYPDDLEISFKDGVMESSYDEPFYYTIEQLEQAFIENQKNDTESTIGEAETWEAYGITHLIVIDDTQEMSLEVFKEYSSFAVFFQDGLILLDDEYGGVRVQPYALVDTVVQEEIFITAESIDEFLEEKIPNTIRTFKVGGLIGFFILHWIVLVSHLAGLALVALIAWGIISIKKSNQKYGDIFRDTLTLSLIPFIAFAIVTITTVDTHLWRFLGIMLIVVVAENFYRKEKEEIVTIESEI